MMRNYNTKPTIKLEEIDQKQYPRLWTYDKFQGRYFEMNDYTEFTYDKAKPKDQIKYDIDEIIEKLQKIRMEFKKDDKVVYYEDHSGCYYESDKPSYRFVPTRPETDQEYCDRVAVLVDTAQKSEEYQKRQYEELKKKYEGAK